MKRSALLGIASVLAAGYVITTDQQKRDKWLSFTLPPQTFWFNLTHGERKQTLFESLEGNVLELGPGSGGNFPYFPKHINWNGVDKNSNHKERLEETAADAGFPKSTLGYIHADANDFLKTQNSDTYDSVVCTRVLSCMENYNQTLDEIHRILKPGGRFYFVDYTMNHNLKVVQYIMNPIRLLFSDTRITLPIAEDIHSKFKQVYMEYWPRRKQKDNPRAGILLVTTAFEEGSNKSPTLSNISGLTPIVAGIAIKEASWGISKVEMEDTAKFGQDIVSGGSILSQFRPKS